MEGRNESHGTGCCCGCIGKFLFMAMEQGIAFLPFIYGKLLQKVEDVSMVWYLEKSLNQRKS